MNNSIKKQIQKEVIITCILYIFYFLWWVLFGLGLGSKDTKDYSYIMGLPDWFFLSCVMGFIVFSLLVYIVLKLFFKDIPLDLEIGEEPENNN